MSDRISIDERMKCNSPIDAFARHSGVNTLDDLLKWVEMERRSYLEMIERHDIGTHKLSDDVEDFALGKSAVLWEVHVNLLHVMRGLQNDKG